MFIKMKNKIEEVVQLGENLSAEILGSTLTIKGPKGQVSKILFDPKIKVNVDDKRILFSCNKASKYDSSKINSFVAHVKNMIKGVTDGYEAKLKICSGHFPINVSVERNKIIIKNFLGEKVIRDASILDGVEVKVSGDVIHVKGCDIEKVGQTAANIEKSTYIAKKDRRIFMDGIFIIEKGKK
ncbi:MAG: 50S ribosomal protein L6 [Nanoarchaeota archaeon]